MSDFNFFYTIQVRYADVDAQRHVNNACYFSYMEQARGMYFKHLGLWDGKDFDAIGFILADTRCTFKAPIVFGQPIRVGVRTSTMGSKSMEQLSSIQNAETHQEMAEGHSVIVAYDYTRQVAIPIPQSWRAAITEFDQPA